MLCVLALETAGITPDRGDVLVTGAAGGVGSVAIALLDKLGYRVVASSRRAEQEGDYLQGLGADEIINARELSGVGLPLAKERWAGAVDNVLSQIKYDGAVAACGLAQGSDLPATVLPFILRDVTLAGVNSVLTPREKREEAWGRLASDLDLAKLNSMTSRARLDDVPALAAEVLAGKTRGRWSSISEHRWRATANIGRHYLLDRFRLDIELPETRQGTARDVVRPEKINLTRGERWIWQELEQPRLDLGHRKGHRYEQSPFPHEV